MEKRGTEKYGLSFFASTQFCIIGSGIIFLIAVGILTFAYGATGGYSTAGMIPVELASLLTFAAALVINIKRSNASFGFFYTLAQAVAVYFVLLVALFIFFLLKVFQYLGIHDVQIFEILDYVVQFLYLLSAGAVVWGAADFTRRLLNRRVKK